MICIGSFTLLDHILQIIKGFFVKDVESKTVIWHTLLANFSFCLLTSQAINERHFHVRAIGHGF